MDEEDEDDDDDETGKTGRRGGDSGERFRQEIQAPQEAGALGNFLPDKVGRKLKAVILGRRKAAAVDESEDEEEEGDGDISPATEPEAEGISTNATPNKVRQESSTTATGQISEVKNYKTFSWDSERESGNVNDEPVTKLDSL